ncbi:hypothetical protein JCM6882_004937 [Rhodosporidiobolus microsporus]
MAPSSGLWSALATAPDTGAGSGAHLPFGVLLAATISAGGSSLLSLWTVWLQLKHYHRPRLQRFVVRILVMVPIYSISSLISLYSLDAAFFVDAFRDVYEAFVIYCFFSLLVEYLGGERSLIITLHGRPPHPHPWPIRWCLSPVDASDPFTFLGLKRGILQYVQLKPLLAAITVILKAFGKYNDGHLAKDSGYTYISILYNLSVSLSLYCLAMFWVATHDDLRPFRPMPKFLCVKGIIFFSFWQSFAVSILVAAGWVKSYRYETEKLSLAIQDTLIALEMPLFAFLHLYAFSYTDYVDENHVYSGRLPVWYALKDAFGYKDLILDSKTTFRGTGFSYRTYEPAAGALHSEGLVRDRRIAAGLRYSTQTDRKYWLDMPRGPAANRAGEAYTRQGLKAGLASRPVFEVKRRLERRVEMEAGYAPGAHDQEAFHVEHSPPRNVGDGEEGEGEGDPTPWLTKRRRHWWEGNREYDELSSGSEGESEADSLEFHGPADEFEAEGEGEESEEKRRWLKEDWKAMERIYREAKELEYGDWSYPVIDASRETHRRRLRDEEDAIFSGRYHLRRGAVNKNKGKEPLLDGSGTKRPGVAHRPGSYGALADRQRPLISRDASTSSRPKKGVDEPTHPATSKDHPAATGSDFLSASKHALSAVLPFSLSRSDSSSSSVSGDGRGKGKNRLPPDAVDLVVEDREAEEEEQIRQRRRGEPSGVGRTRVYRVAYAPAASASEDGGSEDEEGLGEVERGEEVPDPVRGERAEVLDVSSAEEGDEDAEDGEQVVRVAVREEEQTARQAGVDEERRDEEDNPWK